MSTEIALDRPGIEVVISPAGVAQAVAAQAVAAHAAAAHLAADPRLRAHERGLNPHPQYTTPDQAAALAAFQTFF